MITRMRAGGLHQVDHLGVRITLDACCCVGADTATSTSVRTSTSTQLLWCGRVELLPVIPYTMPADLNGKMHVRGCIMKERMLRYDCDRTTHLFSVATRDHGSSKHHAQ